ncbi:GNAT family N-acetyltransferase [Lactococcus nasutitermitis]|uniref:GNAT family N-acetyltransferase n=1 Tax=Lactococcus nasutitermitis TaxID=1652957 RepID=A0ABV9JBR6_9LACT|nr:GNAT family N-acetyltransferase [Lactococcus nasutitermitis]
MKIRPIETKDNQALYQLIQQILKEEKLDLPGTAYYDASLATLSTFYHSAKNAEYFVLVDETDKAIGGVGIAPFSGAICELQKLYVLPAYRGQGYSKKLLETGLDFAKKYYQQIYLETHSSLRTALKLYENYDFKNLSAPLNGSEHSAMDKWLLRDL